MFNIDFNNLIAVLLPALLRKSKLYAWMKLLCSPVMSLYYEFMTKRAADLYNIQHDSRVFSMQAVFNDNFDYETRRIYITDGFTKDRLYIYTPAEAKPVRLGKVYLFNPADYADTGVDFIVWVPTSVPMTNQSFIQLDALIKTYKLGGKRYKVYRVTTP